MRRGVPLPPGFDLTSLREDPSVLERYQLGAEVTGEIGCEWIAQWREATRSGDMQAARAAVEAMASAPDWPILRTMAEEGAWTQVYLTVVKELEQGEVRPGAVEGSLGCRSR